MGAIVGKGRRALRMYNIENRVEKLISKDIKEKPAMSPRFPTEERYLSESRLLCTSLQFSVLFTQLYVILAVLPEAIHEKNEQLLENLKDVKVYSSGDTTDLFQRQLNETRHAHRHYSDTKSQLKSVMNKEEDPFGYIEPLQIPTGHITIRQFLTYLQQRVDKPDEFNVEHFSNMYKLKPSLAENLLRYHYLLIRQEITRPPVEPKIRIYDALGNIADIEDEAHKKLPSSQKNEFIN
ncbi:unnamed protein product [Didymodactylos carnosus]|uniref:Uncharacterized protein n=1 Tax=Didymodactylos carnosus TaxID=1234261 RepID=A0A813PG03_9BILA|nr:unnamed protein product [Didymodactylos carnosus]CAF0780574.1 unnamed protein product [Didymodactylos carnosus]CAF3529314.1 unnamed protein product [Didymodactylos carnosus]CAF3562138.1 unnamed protein product [Didymodactylos carnosus]